MKKIKDIVLACNAGMSTSMLVEKMKENAIKLNIDVNIYAIPQNDITNELSKNANDIGVIMLGPQIKFMLAKIKETASQYYIEVDAIEMADYGMMRGDVVLKNALQYMDISE